MKKKIYFCTHSNLKDVSYGESVNDKKFIDSIPSNFEIINIYPDRNQFGTITLICVIKFILKLFFLSLGKNKIFIIRQTRPGFIPSIFKRIMKHKIILNLGCTPLVSTERYAFYKNPPFHSKWNKLFSFLLKFEFQFEKLLLRRADTIFVENEKAKRLICLYGAKTSYIYILHYYVQNYFLNKQKIDFINNEIFKIGYNGRFRKYDKIDKIIDAIKILKYKNENIILYLIGDGPQREEIYKYSKKLNLNHNVVFLGAHPHKEMPNLMEEFHCLILPMINYISPTTIAIKILEAVMMGKVVITTNSGNNGSLFKPHSKLILDELNPKIIAEKILEIKKFFKNYSKIALKISQKQRNLRSEKRYKEIIIKAIDNLLG